MIHISDRRLLISMATFVTVLALLQYWPRYVACMDPWPRSCGMWCGIIIIDHDYECLQDRNHFSWFIAVHLVGTRIPHDESIDDCSHQQQQFLTHMMGAGHLGAPWARPRKELMPSSGPVCPVWPPVYTHHHHQHHAPSTCSATVNFLSCQSCHLGGICVFYHRYRRVFITKPFRQQF